MTLFKLPKQKGFCLAPDQDEILAFLEKLYHQRKKAEDISHLIDEFISEFQWRGGWQRDQYQEAYASLRAHEVSKMLGPLPPISGLAVELLHPCLKCGRAYSNRSSLQAHWSRFPQHKPQAGELDSFDSVPCQVLQRKPEEIYFLLPPHIRPTTQLHQGSGKPLSVQLGIGSLLKDLPEQQAPSFPPTIRESAHNPFNSSGFPRFLNSLVPKLEISELMLLVQPPWNYRAKDWNPSDSLRNLPYYILHYFTNQETLNSDYYDAICFKIGAQCQSGEAVADDSDSEAEMGGFHLSSSSKPFDARLRSDQGPRIYSKVIIRYIAAMIRRLRGEQKIIDDEGFTPPISQSQGSAQIEPPRPSDFSGKSIVDTFYHQAIPLSAEEKEAVLPLSQLLELDLQNQPSSNQDSPPTPPPNLINVLRVMFFKLFFKEDSVAPQLGSSTLHLLWISAAYNEDGTFVPSTTFTKTPAAFHWAIRFVCLDLVTHALAFANGKEESCFSNCDMGSHRVDHSAVG